MFFRSGLLPALVIGFSAAAYGQTAQEIIAGTVGKAPKGAVA